MTTNENPHDPSKSERSSAGAGATRPQSMKERLLAERRTAEAADAPPVPASKPAPAKPAAGVARPAAPAAKPAAAAAKPAAAASKPASSARAPAEPAAPARPASRPRPRGSAPAESDNADVKREINMLRQRESKTMMIAWVTSGVLVLALGITWFLVTQTKNEREEAARAQTELLESFKKQAESFDVNTPKGARELEAYLQKKEISGKFVDWQNEPLIAGDLSRMFAQAQRTVQQDVDRTAFFDRLERVEGVANNASSMSPAEIDQHRRNVKLLQDKMDMWGDEPKQRVAKVSTTIELVYVQRLWEEARSKAKDPGQLRAAMLSFADAEDAIVKLREKTSGHPDPTGELQKYGADNQSRIYDESDAAAYQLYTPDYISKVEWTDLLSNDARDLWFTDQLEGFEIRDGVMKIVGPAQGSGKAGIAIVPKKIQWRDFQIEMEFEIAKGAVDLYFRYLKRADSAVGGPSLSTGNESDDFPANRKVTFTATCIGSKLTYSFGGVEIEGKTDDPIKWTRTRRGGFGFGVQPGCEMKVTKLRARLLRVDRGG